MNFKHKGEQGYIKFMKSFNLLVAFVLFVIAAILFIIGLSIYDSKGNILTIIGALFIIPMARFLTVWFLFLPYKSVSKQEYDKIFSLMKQGNLLYADVLLTSTEKAYCAAYLVITSDKIFAYTVKNCGKFQDYLADIIKRRAFAYKVTCTDDEAKFQNFLKSADSYAEQKFDDNEEKEAATKERSRLCEVLESFMA
jgi:hypothetical protein